MVEQTAASVPAQGHQTCHARGNFLGEVSLHSCRNLFRCPPVFHYHPSIHTLPSQTQYQSFDKHPEVNEEKDSFLDDCTIYEYTNGGKDGGSRACDTRMHLLALWQLHWRSQPARLP